MKRVREHLSRVFGVREPEKTEPEEVEEVGEKKFSDKEVRVSKLRTNLERRRRTLHGIAPTGEELSHVAGRVAIVALERIKEDPNFINTRVQEDVHRPDLSATEGQGTESLESSMKDDGLKVPIIVEEGPERVLWLRGGWRRWRRAVTLGWKTIPAVVMPANTPKIDAYWANILENTTRKPLTMYEAARAAQLMRDEFGVSAAEFARKTGFSDGYVSKLLTCIDRLPDELKEHWILGTGCSIDEWYRLALLDPLDAIKYFHRWFGTRPKDEVRELAERGKRRRLPPAWLSDRMERLYEGIEGSELEPRTRDVVLLAIEVCMTSRDSIPGVYDPRRKDEYAKRKRLRAELKMPALPDPGEEAEELPPPRGETDDE